MKDQIIKLRKEGRSYREIVKILGCSSSLVAYHLNDKVRQKMLKRDKLNRLGKMNEIKLFHGGACKICGYSKCLNALDFHHLDPRNKSFNVMDAICGRINKNHQDGLEESKKCALICSNCHREIHSGFKYALETSYPKSV